jgi:hypothetical protein
MTEMTLHEAVTIARRYLAENVPLRLERHPGRHAGHQVPVEPTPETQKLADCYNTLAAHHPAEGSDEWHRRAPAKSTEKTSSVTVEVEPTDEMREMMDHGAAYGATMQARATVYAAALSAGVPITASKVDLCRFADAALRCFDATCAALDAEIAAEVEAPNEPA